MARLSEHIRALRDVGIVPEHRDLMRADVQELLEGKSDMSREFWTLRARQRGVDPELVLKAFDRVNSAPYEA